MTIRRKLILSNILMIIIPLLLCAVFSFALLNTHNERYVSSLEEMFESNSGIYSVQGTIEAYMHDVAQGDAVPVRDLESELSGQGYHLRLTRNGKELTSNITAEDQAFLDQVLNTQAEQVADFSVSRSDGSAVVQNDVLNGNSIMVTAVALGNTNEVTESYIKKFIYPFILMISLFTLAVIVVTNLVLSRWIRRSIMTPLDALKEGTAKIADGNLETAIAYNKNDEFSEVCGSFDRMREKLKESVDTRLEYEEARTELINGISHDLRTPLTSIKGYTEGLIDGIADTDEKRTRYYHAIQTRAKDMESMVDSLTAFSRLERGTYQYQLEPADMNQFLTDLQNGYQDEAEQKQVRLILENHAEDAHVLLDRQEMRRVFFNLFSNTIKYRTASSSVIRITTDNTGGDLRIRVSDDGPGVPEADLKKIFNSFYRSDASRTNPQEGSGLGLAVAKQIITGHHGTIRAYNDNGLTVEIILPSDRAANSSGEKDNEKNSDC